MVMTGRHTILKSSLNLCTASSKQEQHGTTETKDQGRACTSSLLYPFVLILAKTSNPNGSREGDQSYIYYYNMYSTYATINDCHTVRTLFPSTSKSVHQSRIGCKWWCLWWRFRIDQSPLFPWPGFDGCSCRKDLNCKGPKKGCGWCCQLKAFVEPGQCDKLMKEAGDLHQFPFPLLNAWHAKRILS